MSDREILAQYLEEGNIIKVRELLENSPLDSQKVAKALYCALQSSSISNTSSHVECIKILLPYASSSFKYTGNTTLLMHAVKTGIYELVSLLLSNNYSASAYDRDKKSVLIHALEVDRDDPVRIVSLLLSHGARVNDPDIQGYTPLHIAAKRGFVDSLNELLVHGADINSKNNNNDTPLHMAVRSNCKPCVEVLLQRGANPNLKNMIKKTPVDEASGNVSEVFKVIKDERGLGRGKGRGKPRSSYRKKENSKVFEQNETFLNHAVCGKCKNTADLYCMECSEGYFRAEQGISKVITQKVILEKENKSLSQEIDRLKIDLKKKGDKIKKLKDSKNEGNVDEQDRSTANGLYSVKFVRSLNSALFLRELGAVPLETVIPNLNHEIDRFLLDLTS